ncbi:MAG TPA: tetratricopeptide repeat protein [Thermoanaerobaculia bacterium]|jgi:tetratricopeptide (TPR) repeat protein|nr:tetratricopeptide repeat protein [Thermoanaerobaculia bacterium]
MPTRLEDAILAARQEDFLRALTLFIDIYGTEDSPPVRTPKDASGLSFFGLSLALMSKKYKPAIDLCRRAIDLEFYNGDHYANLARVYLAAGNRKKALETAEQGLKLVPEHQYLTQVRHTLGLRSRPAVPFLDRTNPINVSLGQARHAKKVSEQEKKRK